MSEWDGVFKEPGEDAMANILGLVLASCAAFVWGGLRIALTLGINALRMQQIEHPGEEDAVFQPGESFGHAEWITLEDSKMLKRERLNCEKSKTLVGDEPMIQFDLYFEKDSVSTLDKLEISFLDIQKYEINITEWAWNRQWAATCVPLRSLRE